MPINSETDKQIVYNYTMQYYSVIKTNYWYRQQHKWISDTILRESQTHTKNNTQKTIPWLHLHEILEKNLYGEKDWISFCLLKG